MQEKEYTNFDIIKIYNFLKEKNYKVNLIGKVTDYYMLINLKFKDSYIIALSYDASILISKSINKHTALVTAYVKNDKLTSYIDPTVPLVQEEYSLLQNLFQDIEFIFTPNSLFFINSND